MLDEQVKALQRLHLDALCLVDADQPVADDHLRSCAGGGAVSGGED